MSISRKLQYQILTEKGKEETPEYEMVQSLPMERAKVVFQGVEGASALRRSKRFFGKDVPSFHKELEGRHGGDRLGRRGLCGASD